MKKNKIAMISGTFILGAIFGISLLSVLSFVNSSNSPSPNQPIVAITTSEANHYFLNYYTRADSLRGKVKGFTVDKLQLEAMNNLNANNSNLVGFRLYMGKNENNENVGIVVGVTARFSDATTGRIYKTESLNIGPCPTLCDVSSPITQNSD